MSVPGDAGRDYVERMRAEGHSDDEVRAALAAGGWSPEEIRDVMAGPPGPPPLSAPRPPPPAAEPTAKSEGASPLAIATLVIGLLSMLVFPLALVAIVLGIIALSRKHPGQGLAIAGMAVAGVALMVMPVMAAILFPVFARAREKARQASCMSNLKQIGLAQLMYATDYDDVLAPADDWPGRLMPYMRNEDILVCPADSRADPHSYGEWPLSYTMNGWVGGHALGAISSPPETALVYDGTRVYATEEPAIEFRHNAGANVAFVDGHVKWLSERHWGEVRWEP